MPLGVKRQAGWRQLIIRAALMGLVHSSDRDLDALSRCWFYTLSGMLGTGSSIISLVKTRLSATAGTSQRAAFRRPSVADLPGAASRSRSGVPHSADIRASSTRRVSAPRPSWKCPRKLCRTPLCAVQWRASSYVADLVSGVNCIWWSARSPMITHARRSRHRPILPPYTRYST